MDELALPSINRWGVRLAAGDVLRDGTVEATIELVYRDAAGHGRVVLCSDYGHEQFYEVDVAAQIKEGLWTHHAASSPHSWPGPSYGW